MLAIIEHFSLKTISSFVQEVGEYFGNTVKLSLRRFLGVSPQLLAFGATRSSFRETLFLSPKNVVEQTVTTIMLRPFLVHMVDA